MLAVNVKQRLVLWVTALIQCQVVNYSSEKVDECPLNRTIGTVKTVCYIQRVVGCLLFRGCLNIRSEWKDSREFQNCPSQLYHGCSLLRGVHWGVFHCIYCMMGMLPSSALASLRAVPAECSSWFVIQEKKTEWVSTLLLCFTLLLQQAALLFVFEAEARHCVWTLVCMWIYSYGVCIHK